MRIRYMRDLAFMAVSLAVAACTSTRTITEPVVYSQAEAADSVRIQVGQSIAVGDLRIRFDAVPSDSRCPSDVVCIWEGDGVATLVAERVATPSSAVSLNLHTSIAPKSGEAHGFKIELLVLTPYPSTKSPIKPDGYSAWIRITPAG
jgi:hypothetical protein